MRLTIPWEEGKLSAVKVRVRQESTGNFLEMVIGHLNDNGIKINFGKNPLSNEGLGYDLSLVYRFGNQ